jgi:hypothetical protein
MDMKEVIVSMMSFTLLSPLFVCEKPVRKLKTMEAP